MYRLEGVFALPAIAQGGEQEPHSVNFILFLANRPTTYTPYNTPGHYFPYLARSLCRRYVVLAFFTDWGYHLRCFGCS
jgi:hypothetical protein